MINQRIKELRHLLKLNQTVFGEKLGVSRSVILNIELNKVAPKNALLKHICEIFNVNENWIIHGTGNVFKSDKINQNDKLLELNELFEQLDHEFQEYILNQMEKLIIVQNKSKSADNIKGQIEI